MTCASAAGRGQAEDTLLVHSLGRQRIRYLGVNRSLRGVWAPGFFQEAGLGAPPARASRG